ncbi:MAG: restriction endonuclease subunit S [Cyclobacteriaceae bacterium]|nr:restriction endonuclease subunit S [Cytophagales bacterium]MCZ8326828.1 restriction endonuclease subunit S [Cyclobacteriaceae bacterium]
MKLRKEKWDNVRLEKLSHGIEYGLTASSEDSGDTILLRITDVNENGRLNEGLRFATVDERTFSKYQLKPNNVLIARSGATAGKAYIHKSAGRFIFASYMLRIVLKEDALNPDFFFTFLSSENYNSQLGGIKVGSAQPNVNTTNLATLQIPLPSIEEQKQIAALFQSIEAAMEQVDGQEKNLKALQKSLVDGLLSKEPKFGNLLNSKNCTATSFGEIAECDKKYPEHEKKVERFVGLEWIEADNFQLQGFGLVANGTTFTKRFAKGDVLFGKRRAYLKKVAVADFDGICSGDILVIRAKAKKMLQGLLPYYISADAFINHAVSTSAGSLSPRTKWKDLETFEIAIPDLKTQKKILEVLQQFDTAIQQLKQQKATLKLLKQKLLNEILG